ncbi:RNA polymerase sigma factor [Dyadobacter fermentans]|uniref:RNA polymerase, sigma-24 subunit, ECF subfamily n=1 Tax=Dyadobacter fermentans (strain ATCC 700827 / DSM 18053 / CIP 107007 / KCTC 52180 / NS114) TaxID=471854 RepID=C6VUU7_DYAFD|nr:sigma-70 family RNA polymerase sigma factor [Dyadobacter fermentans]ACT93084.1 RNA polymerase, sigma-24 subunit, ECF subfamily [Dyadobacter fermentans DSM 18053]
MEKPFDNASDLILWQRLREDDEGAFTELTRRYYRKLLHYGQKFTSNTQLAEDALQDLLVNLWLHRKSVKETPSVNHYLMKAFRNQIFKAIKVANRTIEWQDQLDELRADILSEENHFHGDQSLDFGRMTSLLTKLPERQKEVLYLRFFHDLSPEEIASMLEIKPQSVRNIIQRALTNLREHWIAIILILTIYYNYCNK